MTSNAITILVFVLGPFWFIYVTNQFEKFKKDPKGWRDSLHRLSVSPWIFPPLTMVLAGHSIYVDMNGASLPVTKQFVLIMCTDFAELIGGVFLFLISLLLGMLKASQELHSSTSRVIDQLVDIQERTLKSITGSASVQGEK